MYFSMIELSLHVSLQEREKASCSFMSGYRDVRDLRACLSVPREVGHTI